jgi:hypothetical protein
VTRNLALVIFFIALAWFLGWSAHPQHDQKDCTDSTVEIDHAAVTFYHDKSITLRHMKCPENTHIRIYCDADASVDGGQ